MRWKSKTATYTEWRRWFAWQPICIDGVNIWLEPLERKGTPVVVAHYFYIDWKYRELSNE